MTENYDPPVDKIKALLASRTPEQLAVAYLRAAKRARDAETAFKLMDGIAGVSIGAATGNRELLDDAMASMNRTFRTMKQR